MASCVSSLDRLIWLKDQPICPHRKRRLRENLTWLEEQQATLNQQVKLGGKLVKGGGSSSTKRARIGRGYWSFCSNG